MLLLLVILQSWQSYHVVSHSTLSEHSSRRVRSAPRPPSGTQAKACAQRQASKHVHNIGLFVRGCSETSGRGFAIAVWVTSHEEQHTALENID